MKKSYILALLLCFTVFGTLKQAIGQAAIPNGLYSFKGYNSGSYIDLVNTTAGNQRLYFNAQIINDYIVDVSRTLNTSIFNVVNTGDGTNTYTLINMSTGSVADVSGSLTATGSLAIVASATGSSSQKWQFFLNAATNAYEIRGVASGKDMAQLNGAISLNNPSVAATQLFTLQGETLPVPSFSYQSYSTVVNVRPPSTIVTSTANTATFSGLAGNATSQVWQYQLAGSTTWNNVTPTLPDGSVITTAYANSRSLSIKLSSGNNFSYLDNSHWRLSASNYGGTVYSNVATLTVNRAALPPVFTSVPTAQTVVVSAGTRQIFGTTTFNSNSVTFTGVATNATSYSWQYTNPNGSWVNVSAEDLSDEWSITAHCTNIFTNSLTFTLLRGAWNAVQFRLVATNAAGSAYSTPAMLSVSYPISYASVNASVTGLPETAATKVTVYPNPASNVLNVTGLTTGSHLTLLDMAGKKVAPSVSAIGTTQSIDISTKAKGIYIVNVIDANGKASNIKVEKL